MRVGSAPGPDGFLTEFYKVFWDVTRDTFVQIVNIFLESGFSPLSFKRGRVILPPKEGGIPSFPGAWRPITLLNVDYKIVASLLVKRMRTGMPYIVGPFLTCWVPGRSIFTSLLLTRDLFPYAVYRGFCGIHLSLDQAKVSDRVEHGYPFAVLEAFGFPPALILLLNNLYTDVCAELVV